MKKTFPNITSNLLEALIKLNMTLC